MGADGALMISPYYNKPTQEGLYQHFKKVAESVDIPIVLYNIPGRTAVNMEVDTIARLAKIPNIVGIKEASGSMKQITDIIARCGDDFDVVSGEDFLTYPADVRGRQRGHLRDLQHLARGHGRAVQPLPRRATYAEARKLYYRLLPLCHALFYETNPAPVKAALAMMGKIASDEVRLPLVTMSQANRDKLRRDLQDYDVAPSELDRDTPDKRRPTWSEQQ